MKPLVWLDWLAPLSLAVVDRLRLMERFPAATARIRMKWVTLKGGETAWECTRRLYADMISIAFIGFVLIASLGATAGEGPYFFLAGAFAVCLAPLYLVRSLEQAVKRRNRSILYELPELVSNIVLLVNAGETLQQAIVRAVTRYPPTERLSPLYRELWVMVNELRNNGSFHKAMEAFGKRCGLPETSMFAATVLLNYRRGGDELVIALRELGRVVWERRKAMAKTLGEEASSKMVFPLMLIFMVVMLIVAAPAIMAVV